MFDAHCHIFTIYYLILEVINMGWDMLWHTYPSDPPKDTDDNSVELSCGYIWEFLKWLLGVLDAAFGTEKENMDALRKAARCAGWPNLNLCNRLITVPLMMDIYYMFAYQVGEQYQGDLLSQSTPEKSAIADNDKFFDKFLTAIAPSHRVSSFIRYQRHALKQSHDNCSQHISWTLGFRYQYVNLRKLVRWHKNQLYPFFALDPRRSNVIKSLLDGQLVNHQKGPFYGIKLYPRFGYHPACEALLPVYQYCEQNNIPITTHTSKNGFPPDIKDFIWPEEKAMLGHPDNFKTVLEQYPNLHINFAHFGMDASETIWKDWADAIIQLMQVYPNVYSDLSCYTKAADLNWFKSNYWDNAATKDVVRMRTMFGSDFDVMFFTNVGAIDLTKYFKQFKERFTNDEIIKMSSDLPSAFLML